MKKIKLSVILPVYSEKESVTKIINWLEENIHQYLYEVIIALSPKSDTKSKSICLNLARKDYIKLLMQKVNPGVGRAYREGFAEATGTHILMMDSDGEMDIETIPKMIRKIEETNCDVVIGSRWIKGGGVKGYNSVKYIFNRLYQYVFRVLYMTQVHDLSLGFKILKIEIVNKLGWTSIYNEIGLETSLRPIKWGYNIEEVPVRWTKRIEGKSTNNMLKNLGYLWLGLKILFDRTPPEKLTKDI